MTAFDNRVVVVGDTTLVSEGVNAITAGKIVLWVRTDKDPVVFSAYDADAVTLKGYTMEQPAFVVFKYENTGVAFNTGVESFSSLVVGDATDENQATSLKYVQEQIANVKNEITQETATGFLKKDGTDAMQGDLNMALHAVYGATKYIAVNADGSKAVSLQHVDGGEQDVAQFGNAEGQAVRLGNVADPVSDTDAVNKAYLRDNTVPAQGGAMTGNLDMGGNNIINLKTPVNDDDAANKSYVDTELSETVTEIQSQIEQNSNVVILPFTTATFSEVKSNMDSGKVVFLRVDSDTEVMYLYVINVAISDSSIGLNALLSTGGFTIMNYIGSADDLVHEHATGTTQLELTLRGDETILKVAFPSGSQDVILTGIKTPTQPNDAANKQYVDDKIASSGGAGNVVILQPTNTLQDIVDNKDKVIYLTMGSPVIATRYLMTLVFDSTTLKTIVLTRQDDLADVEYYNLTTEDLTTTIATVLSSTSPILGAEITFDNVDTVTIRNKKDNSDVIFRGVKTPTNDNESANKKYVDDKFTSISTSEVITQLTQQIAGLTEQLSALTTKVDGKADASTVTALQSTVNGKANQTDLTALTTRVSTLETWKNKYNGVITTLYNG